MRVLLLSLFGLVAATTALAGEAWEPGGGLAALSAAEARGRAVYRAEVCWTCHGPQARAAVSGLERPGPVRSEGWLLAHLYDPRRVHPRSPMPGWPQLFATPGHAARQEVAQLIERFDADGDGRVAFTTDARPAWQEHGVEVARMTDLDVAGVRFPPRAVLQTRSGEELWPGAEEPYVDRFVPGEDAGDGVLSLRDVRPTPSARALDLLRYLRAVRRTRARPQQAALDKTAVTSLLGLGGKLATRRDEAGQVRARLQAPAVVPPRFARTGAVLYARHCASCHGGTGRGDGAAAAFLDTPPTDLVTARFKYRSTPAGDGALLTDLFRTVRHGLPGSGMAGLRHAPPEQVWAVVLHVRGLARGERRAGQALAVPPVPTLYLATQDDHATYARHVARGKALFVAFECSRCHGTEGRGDGPDAIVAWSDGRQVRARDFKPRDGRDQPRQRMRGGAAAPDLWRTIMAGLDTEGMPGVHAVFDVARRAQKPRAIDARLVQPLKDPALFEVGVQASSSGPYEERITTLYVGAGATGEGWRSFGDDWALVLYLLHLMRTEDEVQRDVMAWPQIEVRK